MSTKSIEIESVNLWYRAGLEFYVRIMSLLNCIFNGLLGELFHWLLVQQLPPVCFKAANVTLQAGKTRTKRNSPDIWRRYISGQGSWLGFKKAICLVYKPTFYGHHLLFILGWPPAKICGVNGIPADEHRTEKWFVDRQFASMCGFKTQSKATKCCKIRFLSFSSSNSWKK